MTSAVCIVTLLLLLTAGVASAHVTIQPDHSSQGRAEQYTVTVPAERIVPTVKVQLLIPAGVVVYSYGAAPGWQRALQEDAQGRVTAITWSGGLIPPGEYAQFSFMARNPGQGARLVWKAYQTYGDGVVDAFTNPQAADYPAPVTVLGTSLGSRASPTGGSGGGGDTSLTAEVALALSLLGLALSMLSTGLLVVAIRRRIL